MQHGLILLRVPKRRQTLGAQKNQRHAPCPQKSNRTAVGLSRPSTSFIIGYGRWLRLHSGERTERHLVRGCYKRPCPKNLRTSEWISRRIYEDIFSQAARLF